MQSLTKPQKILAIMYDLCNGAQRALQYEDIVVAAYRRYKEDFQLRGYPEYPDSSDIHKPLYQMKAKGLIRSANKTFMLTTRGLEVASQLTHVTPSTNTRLTKQEEHELNRILSSTALSFFTEGKRDRILDTDFYEYLGITVRTSRAECLGRIENVECAIQAYESKRSESHSAPLRPLHTFLIERFMSNIESRK